VALDLASVKRHLNIPATSTGDDAELADTLARAVAVLGQRVGPLTPTTITNEVHTGPGPLVLDVYPVISVTTATAGGVAVLDAEVDRSTGELFGSFGYTPRGVRVTYVAGYDPLPADLELAALEMTAHLWRSQRGGGSGQVSFPGEGEQDDDDANPAAAYLLPYRVQSAIDTHRLPPSFG